MQQENLDEYVTLEAGCRTCGKHWHFGNDVDSTLEISKERVDNHIKETKHTVFVRESSVVETLRSLGKPDKRFLYPLGGEHASEVM